MEGRGEFALLASHARVRARDVNRAKKRRPGVRAPSLSHRLERPRSCTCSPLARSRELALPHTCAHPRRTDRVTRDRFLFVRRRRRSIASHSAHRYRSSTIAPSSLTIAAMASSSSSSSPSASFAHTVKFPSQVLSCSAAAVRAAWRDADNTRHLAIDDCVAVGVSGGHGIAVLRVGTTTSAATSPSSSSSSSPFPVASSTGPQVVLWLRGHTGEIRDLKFVPSRMLLFSAGRSDRVVAVAPLDLGLVSAAEARTLMCCGADEEGEEEDEPPAVVTRPVHILVHHIVHRGACVHSIDVTADGRYLVTG